MQFMDHLRTLVALQPDSIMSSNAMCLDEQPNFMRACSVACYREIDRLTGDILNPTEFIPQRVEMPFLVDLLEILFSHHIAIHAPCVLTATDHIQNVMMPFLAYGDTMTDDTFAECYGVEKMLDGAGPLVNTLEAIAQSCLQEKDNALLAYCHLITVANVNINTIAEHFFARHVLSGLRHYVESQGIEYKSRWNDGYTQEYYMQFALEPVSGPCEDYFDSPYQKVLSAMKGFHDAAHRHQ